MPVVRDSSHPIDHLLCSMQIDVACQKEGGLKQNKGQPKGSSFLRGEYFLLMKLLFLKDILGK